MGRYEQIRQSQRRSMDLRAGIVWLRWLLDREDAPQSTWTIGMLNEWLMAERLEESRRYKQLVKGRV